MKYLLLMSLAVLGGCGHLFFPAVQRLSPDEQAQVDQTWNNMLTPPGRLDRELLLDTIEAFQLHATGIDRLKLECEKDFNGGTVHMIVDFNRRRPVENDRFVIIVRDRQQHVLRKETYSSEEVLSHGQQLFGPIVSATPSGSISITLGEPTTNPTTMPTTAPTPTSQEFAESLTEQQKAQLAWHEARWRQIQAATQPAELPAASK